MIQTVSVAVGKQYEKEVERLLEQYPKTILITENTQGIEKSFEMSLLNGLATKCAFGTLLPSSLEGSIIFCDADLRPNTTDPLQYFSVKKDTEIAYVVYEGVWNFPKRLEAYQKAIEKVGKLNSGFLYFKDINICKDVCKKWHEEFVKRNKQHLEDPNNSTGIYDEPALIAVLAKENYKIEFLDPRWNVWDTSSIPKERAYFLQDHLDGYNMYKITPNFRNEG